MPLRVLLVSAVGLLVAGCLSIDLLAGADAPLEESVVLGRSGPKVLLVEIDGLIDGGTRSELLFGGDRPGMVSQIREVLDRAREDKQVRALLLRIDSPGGSATASEQIYTQIVQFAQEREIPVVAQLLSTATSGGYYVAMAADTVQAHPTTVTGSIGVVFNSLSVVGLMEKLGVENQSVRAGEHKETGSPFRRLTDDERGQIQSIVDELHGRFREIVARGRPALGEERIAELADGRLFSARQALDAGLVDRVGTLDDAVEELQRRLEVDSVRVVAYHRPRETRRNLYAAGSVRSGSPLTGVASWEPEAGAGSMLQSWSALDRLLARPGFLCLWWPGL